jgi:hypothetical protein
MSKLTAFSGTRQLTTDDYIALAIKTKVELICEKCPGHTMAGCFYSWAKHRIAQVCPKLRTELGTRFYAVEEDEDGNGDEQGAADSICSTV